MRTFYSKKCDKIMKFYADNGNADNWSCICAECESRLDNQ